MKYWIVFLSIVLVGVLLYTLTRPSNPTESYVDFANVGRWGNTVNDFTKSQRSYFWNNDKQVQIGEDVRLTVSAGSVNDALRNPDMYTETAITPDALKDYSQYFEKTTEVEKQVAQCMVLQKPTDIERNVGDTFGCGWWYSDNDAVDSTGGYGTFEKPAFPKQLETKVPGGKWIWNKDEAVMMEKIKRCRKIKTCEGISGANSTLKDQGIQCGFCNDMNMKRAIPIDKGNFPEYPNQQNATCSPDNILTDSSKCVQNNVDTAVTGTANNTNTSQQCNAFNWVDEYDPVLKITRKKNTVTKEWVNEEACNNNKKGGDSGGSGGGGGDGGGGGGGGAGGGPVTLCTPVNGVLTRNCLAQQAINAGFQQSGRLYVILASLQNISQVDELPMAADRYAYITLQNAGVFMSIEIFGRGNISVDGAASIFTNIKNKSTHSNPNIRNAALWFINGTAFDMCKFSDADTGPYPVECLQEEFRKTGCQASGMAYPTRSSANNFTGTPWGTIKNQFSKLYSDMFSVTNTKLQDEAVEKCLGTSIVRPVPEVCEESGIEYLVYSRASNTLQPVPQTFVGRVISKTGILNFGSTQNSLDLPLGRLFSKAPNGMQIVRTVKTPPVSQQLTSKVLKLRGENPWRINGQEVTGFQQQSVISATEEYGTYSLPLTAKQPNVLTYTTGGRNRLSIEELTQSTLKDYQLIQDSWKPVIGFDFYKEKATDSNNVIELNPATVQYQEKPCSGECQTKSARKGISTRNLTLQWKTGIHEDVVQAITACVYLDTASTNGLKPFITIQQSTSVSVEMAFDVSDGQFRVITTKKWQTLMGARTRDNKAELVATSSLPLGRWTHIAVSYKPNTMQLELYLNGEFNTFTSINLNINSTKFMANNVRFFGPGLDATVAWIHIYDYPLNLKNVQQDMNYDNDFYVPTQVYSQVPRRDIGCENIQYKTEIDRTAGAELLKQYITPSSMIQRVFGPQPSITTMVGDCCRECSNTAECNAFEYDPTGNANKGSCSLFKNASKRKAAAIDGKATFMK